MKNEARTNVRTTTSVVDKMKVNDVDINITYSKDQEGKIYDLEAKNPAGGGFIISAKPDGITVVFNGMPYNGALVDAVVKEFEAIRATEPVEQE